MEAAREMSTSRAAIYPPAVPFAASRFGGGWRGGRVVYCGGLENRFGFTADGGSNPSLSAISGLAMVKLAYGLNSYLKK